MTKVKKATTVAGISLGGTGVMGRAIASMATTKSTKRTGSVSGNTSTVPVSTDAALDAILASSQQTNQVLTKLVDVLGEQQRGSVVMHHGSSDGSSHLDGEYVRVRGQNVGTTLDSATLKRVRDEGLVKDKSVTSPQQQSIQYINEELDTLRAVFDLLRTRLADVLPEGLGKVMPRLQAVVGNECAEASDNVFSRAELDLMAMRRRVVSLREDMEYTADHLRC